METRPVPILVVDGDSASRNYLAGILKKNGYDVLTASLGREGLISAWRDLPVLIIMDPELPDISGLELVTRLRQDRRTVKLPCVAFSVRQDSQLINNLLSAGCNEFIAKSNQAISRLLELIPQLLGEITSVPRERGALISFLSAKGGTGTSSLCANIAMCLGAEKPEMRIALIDMVLPIGSIASIVGYDDRMNLVTVSMQNPDQLTPAFFTDNLPLIPNWCFHLLAGSPNPESANRLEVSRLNGILEAILESYDFTFVDMGRTLSRVSIPIIKQSNVLVMIVGGDLATATLTKEVWNFLQNQDIDQSHIYFLQNRAIGLEGLSKKELEQVLGMPIRSTMPYMSGNFTLANNRHEPVLSKFPIDSAAITLKQATLQIIELCQEA
jgi:Flp pilus assembly CpaE family ATPase